MSGLVVSVVTTTRAYPVTGPGVSTSRSDPVVSLSVSLFVVVGVGVGVPSS